MESMYFITAAFKSRTLAVFKTATSASKQTEKGESDAGHLHQRKMVMDDR
jgi:hypothetical protein